MSWNAYNLSCSVEILSQNVLARKNYPDFLVIMTKDNVIKSTQAVTKDICTQQMSKGTKAHTS